MERIDRATLLVGGAEKYDGEGGLEGGMGGGENKYLT